MKKPTFIISLIFFSSLLLTSLSYANGKIIYGCYKKNNGQLRIVNFPGACHPSELPISWNQTGPAGPSGPAGPQGSPGISVQSFSLPEGDPNCPLGGTLFRSINGDTYACNGGGEGGSSVIVKKIPAGQCSNGNGWCPNGFGKWLFKIQDSAVSESSVISINVINPHIIDSGCEVGAISAGSFQIFCVGQDYVESGAILHYAVFN